jgi:hypothetical protein
MKLLRKAALSDHPERVETARANDPFEPGGTDNRGPQLICFRCVGAGWHLSVRLDACPGIKIDKMPLQLFYPALEENEDGCSNNLGHTTCEDQLTLLGRIGTYDQNGRMNLR